LHYVANQNTVFFYNQDENNADLYQVITTSAEQLVVSADCTN
jgi:hypothetical protein